MATLVFVGVATDDTIALVERFPTPDERMIATAFVRAGGGPAATAAVTAARLGHDVTFVGAVGDDAEGERVVDDLAGEGIDVRHVTRVEGSATASSIVLVDAGRATRAIVHRPGPSIELDDTAIAIIRRADWVHVDHAGWAAVGGRRAAGSKLSVDGGNPIEGFSPDGVDLYVPTLRALRDRYGDLAPRVVLGAAVDEGAVSVVATDGERGAYLFGRDHPFTHVPAVLGPVCSTLGAGDVFHGALLAGVAASIPLVAAVANAAEVAYRSCLALDGRSGIPIRVAQEM